MKTLHLILFTFLFLTGCASTTIIYPKYDEKNKSLSFKNHSIKGTVEKKVGTKLIPAPNAGNVKVSNILYKINGNTNCKKVTEYVQRSSNKIYFRYSAYDLLQNHYKNTCSIVDKIGVNKFVICENYYQRKYFIVNSLSRSYGKNNLRIIEISGNQCFQDIKNSFLNHK